MTATKADVRRLRALVREPARRRAEGVFVAEGPNLLAHALDLERLPVVVYVAADAAPAARAVVERVPDGVPVEELTSAGAARIAATRSSMGVFALMTRPQVDAAALASASLGVVATVNDPGNAGTLVRAVAAFGGQAIALSAGSVDAYNPKLLRASAGACFAIPVVEDMATTDMLEACRSGGARLVGAAPRGGVAPEALDLRGPTVVVLGHETRGLEPNLDVDAIATIPMVGAESLNVAMAGTVLLSEAARQRRVAGRA